MDSLDKHFTLTVSTYYYALISVSFLSSIISLLFVLFMRLLLVVRVLVRFGEFLERKQ